jgi:biopolymer transport protein ExbD
VAASWGDEGEFEPPEQIDLNLTSLVDVVLVLLVTFMVSTSAIAERDRLQQAAGQVQLQLPTGSTPSPATPPTEVTVQVDADGQLFLGGAPTEWRSLSQDLTAKLAKDANLQVRVDADQRLPVQKAVEVLERLQALGIQHVGLGTQDK